MKKWLMSVAFLASTGLYAQVTPLWLRYPSISPDGKNIVFGYKGDIYRVPTEGGAAIPLTLGESQEMMPVWSHDGKYIAFASDRYGNFDVFVMPASGGETIRLTTNSAADYPYDFTPDNKKVLFASSRNAPAKSIRFNYAIFKNLYEVPVSGGRPMLVSAAGSDNAHFNSKGDKIVFQDSKGYEDPWRKHHVSAITRDIWVYDLPTKTYSQISDFAGEDREPLFSSDDQSVFYLSEKKGTQNLFKRNIASGSETQLTSFKDNPVRHLSRANDNTLVFSWNGEIYSLKEGGQPFKIPVQIMSETRENIVKNTPVMGSVSEFVLSPSGKEIAYVNRGEVFVSSIEGKFTKRITNTPSQERMVEWSADGKAVIYSAERNGSWDIYKTTIVSPKEQNFFAATLLKETPVIATEKDEFKPKYSPDGKSIAYIEERNVLKVYNLESKTTKTLLPFGHNYSYSDGDWDFAWSPDSKWLLVDDQKGYFSSNNAALIKADGTGKIVNPINSGFGEGNNKWGLGGKMFTYESDKLGRKSLATQGSRESDIYAAFFDKKSYDQFILSKDDYDLIKDKNEEGKDKKKDSSKIDPDHIVFKDDSKSTNLDWKDIDQRIVRLTINSSSIADYVLNKDASKLYYLSAFEKGYDLWVTDPRTHDTKILVKLGGSPSGLEMSKDGKSLFVSNRGSLVKVDATTGAMTPISIDADMALNPAAERSYIFEHAWRQVEKKFYDTTLHGINWKYYHDNYARFLPHINNNYDFQELLSELLGELNGSHTGGRYRPMFANSDATATLGLLYDETYTGKGLKVTEVLASGPFDKVDSKLKAGDIITAIDGVAVADSVDWASLLNRKAGRITSVSIAGKSDETVRPISVGEEGELMYARWTKRMEKLVDSLSGGKVGYVHVRGMNDGSFRETYDQVMGKMRDKQALIVDTRFNGGGWLHDDLNTLLSGKNYLRFAPQGHMTKGGEPMSRWQKPSCVVMSEGNYSDAFIFPYTYKEQSIGKLIGMPVAGTGTAVWWETQIDPTLIFGIPMVATIGKENRPTENLQVEPDIRVPLKYEDFLNGQDNQMKTAVQEMLKEIGK
ncbi:MAG: peptidase S41 [Pseudopedobacter saltans]|uniref:Tricorn protease homolog n=1 Tax=Pseudopedobacter saltans TaxID=151895 RepID=A0A2W5EXT9_9SPHI|nr:MAG: peptidase S41 [Pseudopedobacter saltans]